MRQCAEGWSRTLTDKPVAPTAKQLATRTHFTVGGSSAMSNVHLVLVGDENSFKVCAAFHISEHAKTYANGFKHHQARVWVHELALGVSQDFRIGDKPFTVRFNR